MNVVKPDNRWNDFCQSSTDSWFWHSTEWLDYSLAYRLGRTSLSFMVEENKELLAICPLILSDSEFIMHWSPVFSDNLALKKREKVINFTFEEIDRLALENNVKRASFMIYPLSFPSHNFLMKQEYLDISLNTQVIDLTQDLESIHSTMRKGHDYDIDKGLKSLDIWIQDSDNIGRETFDEYCKLLRADPSHAYETRPQVTYDMQYDWIKEEYAILLGASHKGEWVGFSYIFTYKNKAYYGSACSNSDLPVAHALTWKTIEWLKEHGFEYYEIGWQQYGSQLYDFPSAKEVSISKFKRGFGGYTIPLFRGERYYDNDYFLKVTQERAATFFKEQDSV